MRSSTNCHSFAGAGLARRHRLMHLCLAKTVVDEFGNRQHDLSPTTRQSIDKEETIS
jgi:hypothetical protein